MHRAIVLALAVGLPAASLADEPAAAAPLMPLSTVKPVLPDSACQQRLSGVVELDFAVLPDGRVADVKVTASSPRDVFDAAAVASVSAWTYPPRELPAKVHQRLPMSYADCTPAQLARQRSAGPADAKADCAALASEGQLQGDPFEGAEAAHRVIEKNGAQVFTAPDPGCVVKGRILGNHRPLTAYAEYKGFTYVSDPKEGRDKGFWVWSNALGELGGE